MALLVEKAGFLTTVQDYGRLGLQQFGITQGGPMDEHAFLWANKLLSNHFNASQLEICMGGFVGRFQQDTVICLCGADADVRLNNQPIAQWQAVNVAAGDELHIHGIHSGVYIYLAVKQGFNVPMQLGSASTVMREKLGGITQNGTRLADGAELGFTVCTETIKTSILEEFKPNYSDIVDVRVVLNKSSLAPDELVIEQFLKQTYIVSPQSNRMGFRLSGAALNLHDQTKQSMISQGVSLGAIQLPPDGQPIVLMKDRQTMGGYPQIACVAYLDIAKLSQCKPGTQVNFQAVDVEDLSTEMETYLEFFAIDYSSGCPSSESSVYSQE